MKRTSTRIKEILSQCIKVVCFGVFCVTICTSMQLDALAELQDIHFGIIRTKMIARSVAWRPNIDSCKEQMISEYEVCHSLRNKPPKAQIHNWIFSGYFMVVHTLQFFTSFWLELFLGMCQWLLKISKDHKRYPLLHKLLSSRFFLLF